MTVATTFPWSPDIGAEQKVTPSVHVTKFGDGYELRVAKGINFKPKVWNVSFTRTALAIVDILKFLEERGGMEAFSWKDPMNATGTYVCRQWGSSQQSFGLYTVNATFEQVFEY